MDVIVQRRRRFLAAVLDDKRGIRDINDARLFVAAVCDEQDSLRCIAKLCEKGKAFAAARQALLIDLSSDSLNGHAAQFILYFATDSLRQVAGGRLLCDLLTAILKPDLLWSAYKTAAFSRKLTDSGLYAFASLMSELLSTLPPSSELASQLDLKRTARALVSSKQLHRSDSVDVRRLAYSIDEAVRSSSFHDNSSGAATFKPGGRHDNDFADFRKISIFPTKDELLSNEPPYMLPLEEVLRTKVEVRVDTHLDNQFRLLREDMLAELRDDLKHSVTTNHTKQKGLHLRSLQFSGVHCGLAPMSKPAAIAIRCFDPIFRQLPEHEDDRKKYLAENKGFIKHGLFGCILASSQVIAFGTIEREEELLARTPPILLLRLIGDASVRTALLTLKLKRPHEIDFVAVDTPYFAYEPVLRCLQQMPLLPLADVILGLKEHDPTATSPHNLEGLAIRIRSSEGQDISHIIGVPRRICLDHAQTESLATGLTQAVAQIQGPPGTGKSFIGAMLTRLFLDHVQRTRILVLCYTNHALDQFLEDILDMGVHQDQVLRLGAKSTKRTEPMTLQKQANTRAKLPHAQWAMCQYYKSEVDKSARKAADSGSKFSRWKRSDKEILESLEFDEESERFYEALSTPGLDGDMSVAGSDGKAVDSTYVFQRWSEGRNAGIFEDQIATQHRDIWRMSREERQKCLAGWTYDATAERSEGLAAVMREYDADYSKWTSVRANRIAELMKTKRIVACTTTAAAQYADQIRLIKPGTIMVEEAGEVLESHILTALSRDTKQLVMIGDHLQLRPKVKNHALTVERGDGFNVNLSLFERLVLEGHPHISLTKQHRMRPEISALVRQLMYPGLVDGENVLSRPNTLGLQKNVVFIHHQHPEVIESRLKDRQDESSATSRKNVFEAKMILKVVKYLAQQGYGTDNQVVLTPYLGQLRLIMDELKADHDPVLGDLDSHDLVKAGLMSPASASQQKRSLRMSTIDNFQGEEGDIVIVSLTRSNQHGDIGFMSARQRLNVLLSRARNGLIIIGNADTFKRSKKGTAVWTPFFEQLIEDGLFFDGLPVKCEQHPANTVVLCTPEDFDAYCPGGGCSLPCRELLSCGKHRCPEKCHQLVDHSHIHCLASVEIQCHNKHRLLRECWRASKPCPKCERDTNLQKIRQQKQEEYLSTLIALEDQIATQTTTVQDLEEQVKRANTLKQKNEQLTAITQSARVQQEVQRRNASIAPAKPEQQRMAPVVGDSKSRASQAWEHQKRDTGADNEHIDAIMGMIGLEAVKEQVLKVKDKVDVSLRQGANLLQERFNALLLGNPGTGKTTVARHYAKCLASMGIVAGGKVQETTASKLVYGGVSEYKKLVDELMNEGGGSIFIDEAYRLTNGTSAQGCQVLNAIMDDAENLTGKVVFILAGYRKEMEGLLAHNPGISSRFPFEFDFTDYEDEELRLILIQKLQTRFHGRMHLDAGYDGIFARIVARRVGYARGRPGFGNARAMENALARILTRQAARISEARRHEESPDDFLLTRDDMLGPEPSGALQRSKAWTTLRSLIGLESVKESIHALMQSLHYNYDRELREEPPLQFNLNRVFLGSPGTGKTTVAKLYGQVLADLGLLSNGEVVVKNPSDFVGDVLGASEKTTKGILSSTVGKVLIIDEAYGLYSSATGQPADIYKTAVVDTLVAEIQSVPGDDRCLLLLGYQDEMETMLRNANPGLARRFPISEAFYFQDFTDKELMEVVEMKSRQQAYVVSADAMRCIAESLKRARNKLRFGNAGEVDILLNTAKQRHQQRCVRDGLSHNNRLEATDFDTDFGHAHLSIAELFENSVGQDDLVKRLEQIKNVVINMKTRELDPREQVPYNFVFCGPPGTGKTTTARKMGRIYHDLGILATDEVLEKSASDLVGQYVGHTGDKTKKLLESALGKVLLIDEAYRLASGDFAKEATDELVDLLTKPQFAQKLIVILAGYDADIERLMATNPGLTSRFPEKIPFQKLSPKSCITLLVSQLARESFLDAASIQSLASSSTVVAAFERLINTNGWANARDVQNLAKLVSRDMLQVTDTSNTDLFQVQEQHVMAVLHNMIDDRERHAALLASSKDLPYTCQAPQSLVSTRATPPSSTIATGTRAIIAQDEMSPSTDETAEEPHITRDEGVSDGVWSALMADRQKGMDEAKLYSQIVLSLQEQEQKQSAADASSEDEDKAQDQDDVQRRGARLRREQERLRYEHLRRQKVEMEARDEHEKRMQKKLKMMGVCPVGYRWIKQASGYRCAGGSHFVSDAALGGKS